jgi:hypothetical protein
MKKILSLLISILISFQLFAQVELQIGNGITSYFDPLPGYYGWNRSAYLYKLDEIGVGGLVSALAFEIASPSNGSNAKIKIYLKETSATTMPALSATTWNTLKAGATLVYQNNALASAPAGWKIFTFDTQFNYSGTGNLMVLVEGEGCIASGGCRTDCYNHEAPATHWYRRKDSTPPDDNAPSTSPTGQEGKRANIKFTITPPAGFCYPPFNLAATNITSNSADITWNTHSSGISWKVQYKKAIETTWSAEQIHYLGESSLQDLDPATTYDVRVKSVCNTDESGWITVTFTTFCEAVTTFPWIENFDTYGTTSGIYPLCWFRPVLNTSIPYPSIVSGNAVSSPGSLRFLSSASLPTYAITPQMDADINTLMVTFQLRAESTLNSGTMHVGVMSNPLDLSTFELVQIITPITHNYQEYEVLFSNTTLTGAGNCIAFKHVTNSSYYYFLLDDVIVDYIPACRRPLEVSFTNITETSVDLGWFDSGTATSWEVEYGETGFTQGTGTVVQVATNPASITGLTESTCYDFYVRSVCAPGEVSNWSNKRTICTFQAPVDVPFVIDFETPSGFAFANNPSGANWYIGDAQDVNNTTDGSHGLYISDDNGTTNSYSNTPAVVWAYRDIYFTPSTSDYILTFDWKCNGKIYTNSFDCLDVYIGTPVLPVANTTGTIAVPVGAIVLDTAMGQQTTWQEAFFTLPLVDYSGQTKRLYFCWKNDNTVVNLPPAAIDNIRITSDGIEGCLPPTNLAVSNVSSSSALVTWTAGGSESSWQVDYKLLSSVNWTTATAHTTSFTMTGLQSDSQYQIRVKAICTSGESLFTELVFYTTVGIAEHDLSQHVTLYPNPTQFVIDLKLDRNYLGETECHIYDMYGKLMRVLPIEEDITSIDVTNFASGVYIIRLTTEQGQVSKRFVKQ